MKKLLTTLLALTMLAMQHGVLRATVLDDVIETSTIERPIPYYIHCSGQNTGYFWDSNTSPTITDAARFIFIESGSSTADVGNYYIYCLDTGKYIGYTKAASYADGKNFANAAVESASDANYWGFQYNSTGRFYVIGPYNTSELGSRKLNWHGGVGSYGTSTIGLYNSSSDGGSQWGVKKATGWSVSLPLGACMSVGAKAATVTPATSAADNSHWYIVTQTKLGESAMYDNDGNVKRASTTYTADFFNEKEVADYTAYLVRFIATGAPNVYKIQFGNGKYVCHTSTTNDTYVTSGEAFNLNVFYDYLFYNINNTDEHFGWNTTTDGTNYGQQIDNNGAGNDVVMWSSNWTGGEITTTGGNNDWAIYPVSIVMPPLADGGVYSIYCAYTDGDYPIYNDNGSPKVSASTDTAPQLFVFRENGTDGKGASLYTLGRAEGDGKFINRTGDSAASINFTTTSRNFFFLNDANQGSYPFATSNTPETSPYVGLYSVVTSGSNYDTHIANANNTETFNGWSNKTELYGGMLNSRDAATGYNSRWLLKREPYTTYTLAVQDSEGNAVSDVAISYTNADDAAITRTAQTDGGFFVISKNAPPTALMFQPVDYRYRVTGCTISGSTITITIASSAVTTVGEGSYYLWNCGQNRFLVQAGDALYRSMNKGDYADVWEVVPSLTTGQYFIRNAGNGKYLHWAEADDDNFTLVESASDATPLTFSSAEADVSHKGYENGCVSILNPNVQSTGRNHFQMSSSGYMSYYYENTLWEGVYYYSNNDWLIYPADALQEDVDYLVQNTRSGNYMTWAGDAAQMTQAAKGSVGETASVWSLTASGNGYKLSNNATANKLTSATSFTADGTVWYIPSSPHNRHYYAISSSATLSGQTSLNDAASGGALVTAWNANDAGSVWRFVPVDTYYKNAVAYLQCYYDASHKDDLFYLSETGYNTLIALAHGTSAEKVTAANLMYDVLNHAEYFNMPEQGKDYLIKNKSTAKYLNTEETTLGEVADTYLSSEVSYNSTFFWNVVSASGNEYKLKQSCYGAGMPEGETNRYINSSQPYYWSVVASEPENPLTLEAAYGNVLGYAAIKSHEMLSGAYAFYSCSGGGAGNHVTSYKGDDDSRWQFITVEEASVPLIAAAEAAIANGNNGAFTLTETAIANIEAAITTLQGAYNYVNYYELERLLTASSSYYQLETGRYLVRNYEFDTNGDGIPEDTETWLTSMLNPVGTVEDAIGYWSIWDITNNNGGEYYTMQCEGHRYILTPNTTMDDATHRDEGYLYYRAADNLYQVGDAPGDDGHKLIFYPAVTLSPKMPSEAPVNGSYAAISVASQAVQDKYLNMYTRNDHMAYYNTSISDPAEGNRHYDKGFFWQFIPVKTENETNQEGTHQGEAQMFAREVNGLEGYVGGVVTLDNVGSVAPLNDIVLLRNATVAALENNTALNYTSTYDGEALSFAADDDAKGAKAFEAILQKIQRIKNGILPTGYTAMTAAEVKKLYQDLRPTEVFNEGQADEYSVKHPFFLENLSGQRPEFGGRLTESESAWRCDYKANVNSTEGFFYVTRTSGEAGAADAVYTLQNGNDHWMAHGTMETNSVVPRSDNEAEALQFNIMPVIPGVWQMKDTGSGAGTSAWLTITSKGYNCAMHYYFGSETSSLWKFQTFNELDNIYLKVAPGGAQYDNYYFSTFSYPLNIKIPKAGNPTPYYCSEARRNYDKEAPAALQVTFSPLPSDDGYYYLEGGQGYLFMAPAEGVKVVNDASDEHNREAYIDDAEYLTGKIPDGQYVSAEANFMLPNLYTTLITNENWASTYALSYASTETTVGSYKGEAIKGVGMGFYHIRLGGKLNPNTAYIPAYKFTDGDSSIDSSVRESGTPAEMLFEDEDGNLVDHIELMSDGTWQSGQAAEAPIYDLTGRRVGGDASQRRNMPKGLYIQNGKKVMYK